MHDRAFLIHNMVLEVHYNLLMSIMSVSGLHDASGAHEASGAHGRVNGADMIVPWGSSRDS